MNSSISFATKASIQQLSSLGELFAHFVNGSSAPGELNDDLSALTEIVDHLHYYNPWFTKSSVSHALESWSRSLTKSNLHDWIETYTIENLTPKKVGVIMAGNIPLVGFHDAICVLLSGHTLYAKLSSKDDQLMRFVLNYLSRDKVFENRINNVEKMRGIDALIATGSGNSSRYFEHYFKNQKKIIRKNRTSVAVIENNTSDESLRKLGDDVFSHFGLGCRNVTKIYLPKGFDLDRIFGAFYDFRDIVHHNKYGNNYDYNKAVYLLNNIKLLENGFLLLKEDEGIHSPIGVLFYEHYESVEKLELELMDMQSKLQCIVGEVSFANTEFGKSQQPTLKDYADGVDTIKFLIEA